MPASSVTRLGSFV